MVTIMLREILTMVDVFEKNISQGLGYALWSIKHYVALFLIVVVVKIVKSINLRRGS